MLYRTKNKDKIKKYIFRDRDIFIFDTETKNFRIGFEAYLPKFTDADLILMKDFITDCQLYNLKEIEADEIINIRVN